MRSLLNRLGSIPEDRHSAARRWDRRLARGQLELELWENDAPQFHAGNPATYTGEGVFSIISLFLRDSEPLADRVQAAIARMRAIPTLLAQGRDNVSTAPAAWTERAIREARSAAVYFGRGIAVLAEEREIESTAYVEAAEIARTAFEAHGRWLERALGRRASDGYACGEEAFNRYLAIGHCLPSDRDASWVKTYGDAALVAARHSLEELARRIDAASAWQDLLARVPDDHPGADGYYEAFRHAWTEARQRAVDAALISWPDVPIEYIPIPRSDREAAEGLYYLPYRCPAPFGRRETHHYLVSPVEADMTAAEQERRLRAANHAAIKLNHVVHHGGLGHHVQNWHAARAPSRIGQVAGVDGAARIAMFCAGTLVEGWACYATDLMEEIGALSPVESLVQAHGRLRMAARAVADVCLHTGQWTLDETVAFYEREAAMPAPAARAEAVKNSMFPAAAMMYLIGTDAIHDLRRTVAAREGERFSLRSFHDRFLSYGAIPVSLIGEDMLNRPAGGIPDSAV
jgi:hypothetical protein